jgi:hypothetical protein
MSEPPSADPEVVEYLHRHGANFSLESLREQLVASGVSPEQIDAGFAAWEMERLSIPSPPRRSWPLALGIAMATLALSAAAIGWAVSTSNQDAAAVVLSLFPLLAVAELIVGAVFLRSSPRVGKALLLAPLFALALIVVGLLLAFGVCVAAMSGRH